MADHLPLWPCAFMEGQQEELARAAQVMRADVDQPRAFDRRAWNDGYKSGYFDGYRSGNDAGTIQPLIGEELLLPTVQPDRAWAEHLGMPRLIADLRASRDRCAVLVAYIEDMERRLCPCPEHEQQRASEAS